LAKKAVRAVFTYLLLIYSFYIFLYLFLYIYPFLIKSARTARDTPQALSTVAISAGNNRPNRARNRQFLSLPNKNVYSVEIMAGSFKGSSTVRQKALSL